MNQLGLKTSVARRIGHVRSFCRSCNCDQVNQHEFQFHKGETVPKTKIELVEGLNDKERELVIAGLRALRRERGKSWNLECDKAEHEGKRPPGLAKYGIEDIKRLARRFGGRALHWSEE